MAYCQAMPLPVLQFMPRSLNPELFGWAIRSKPLWAEPRMRETRAAARAQLICARNLEDLSDANYRQNVSTCLVTDCVASISLGIMQI